MFDPSRLKAVVPVNDTLDLKKSSIQKKLQIGLKNQNVGNHKYLPKSLVDKLSA